MGTDVRRFRQNCKITSVFARSHRKLLPPGIGGEPRSLFPFSLCFDLTAEIIASTDRYFLTFCRCAVQSQKCRCSLYTACRIPFKRILSPREASQADGKCVCKTQKKCDNQIITCQIFTFKPKWSETKRSTG